MRFPDLLSARFRGFRVVNLLGLTLALTIAVGSYALKIMASAQDAGAAQLEDQIVQEQKRIRMLKLEIASLGAAPRIEPLARQYLGLGPADSRHDIAAADLPGIVERLRAAPAAAGPAKTAAGGRQ